LHPLYVASSLSRSWHIFSPPQREVVHKCAKSFGAGRLESFFRHPNRAASAALVSWS
jgi:hypothetical protein